MSMPLACVRGGACSHYGIAQQVETGPGSPDVTAAGPQVSKSNAPGSGEAWAGAA